MSRRDQLFDSALSPGDRFVAFTRARPDGFACLYVAPLGSRAPTEDDWVQIAEDRIYLGCPAWSPDSRSLYYGSARDGFVCVWAQRIAGDGKPEGQPFAVWHGDALPNFSVMNSAIFAVTPDKLYLMLTEIKGDLWSMKLSR